MTIKKDTDKTVEQIKMEEKALERQAASDEKTVAEQLKAMKKVTIMIPDDPNNPNDKVVPIGFNGIVYGVKRGEAVEVPEAIAEIYQRSYQNTRDVINRIEKSTSTEIKGM